MPEIKTQDGLIRGCEGLLDAAARSPDVQAELSKEIAAVAEPLTEVKLLKARQQELTAQRQEVTQQLDMALARLRDAAIVFRSVVRGKLGIRNERLVHFRVPPLRKRSPRKREKPPDGEAAGTVPDASASPPIKPVV